MNKKIITRLKTGAVMFAVAGAMAFSGAAGAAGTAFANPNGIATCNNEVIGEPNTNDTTYAHSNNNSVSYSKFRYKYNTTKVYIHPTDGPMLYYRVQGAYTAGGSGLANRSEAYGVPVGVQASFTNYVNENHNMYARLKMRHSVTQPIDSKGVWSPDSTRNYTIY